MAEQRQLTVSRLLRSSRAQSYPRPPERQVPFVRMEGNWLEEAGFRIGEKIRIQVEPGRLVLTPREG